MQRFYFRFVKFWLAFCVALTLILCLSACKTVSEHSATVELVISQATMRYVERAAPADRAKRALEIIRISEQIRAHVADDTVSVADLANIALNAIPADLSQADRMLALSVVNIARQELSLRIGEGVLKPEDVASVRAVLDSVRFAAEIYTREPR